MIDKHKRLLPPCNKGFTTHLESMYNTSFMLVGTSGLAPCRLGVPRPMSFYMSKLSSSISFHINKRSSSFYHGKNTSYQFISYYIDNSHFRFSVCLSSDVIFTQGVYRVTRYFSGYSRKPCPCRGLGRPSEVGQP